MKMNYKHLGMYVLAGIVSGGLSAAEWLLAAQIDFDTVIWLAMPITLAAGIYTVGRYVSDTDLRHTWFSPLALVVTYLVGWYLASMFAGRCLDTIFGEGCVFGSFWGVVVSGGIGGICVAIGVAIAWRLNSVGSVITITTVAGLLGGLAFNIGTVVDTAFDHLHVGEWWWLAAPIIWQPILLLGIGIAVQIDSAKSSAEQ